MGEFYPPSPELFFVAAELVALGFGPGVYTVRAPGPEPRPEPRPEPGPNRLISQAPKWHTVQVFK